MSANDRIARLSSLAGQPAEYLALELLDFLKNTRPDFEATEEIGSAGDDALVGALAWFHLELKPRLDLLGAAIEKKGSRVFGEINWRHARIGVQLDRLALPYGKFDRSAMLTALVRSYEGVVAETERLIKVLSK